MGYPYQQGPGQMPPGQGGYPPQQQQYPPQQQQVPPGYQQQGYQQGPPMQGYGQAQQTYQPQGYAPAGPSVYQQAYDQGDASGTSYVVGWHLAQAVECDYNLTEDRKEQYKIKFRFADGTPNQGQIISTTLSLSTMKNDGTPTSAKGFAWFFRRLRSLGVPVGEKYGDPPGSQGFWNPDPANGRPQPLMPAQVAQMIVQLARVVEIEVVRDEEWDNSKVNGIRTPRGGSGAPPAAAAGPPAYQGPPMQQQYPQQPPQPVGGQQGPYNAQQQMQQYAPEMQHPQQQQAYPDVSGGGVPHPPQQQGSPGHPGGMGEFAPQQMQQAGPGYPAPVQGPVGPPMANGGPMQQQQGMPAADQGQGPPKPPWMQ